MDPQNRQEYIRAAVSFLQNPKLLDSSLQDKLKFLKDKGLSELEVDEAINLALINRQHPQHGRWNFLLILGVCIGGYKLYKAYLESKENYMTQQKNLEKQCQEEQKPKDLYIRDEGERRQQENDSPTFTEILQRISELKRLIELQRSNFASDIQSLKTLLLGHEKFAAPPVIPAWQLKDLDGKDNPIGDKRPKDATKGEKKKNDKSRKDNSAGQSCIYQFIETSPIAPIPD